MNYIELSKLDAYKGLVKFGRVIESSKIEDSESEQRKLFIVSANAENVYSKVKRKSSSIDKDTKKLFAKIANTANSLMSSLGDKSFNEENATKLRRRIRRLEKTVKSKVEAELKEIKSIYKIPNKAEGAYKNFKDDELDEMAATLSSDGKKEIKEVIDQNEKVLKGMQSIGDKLPKTKNDVSGTFVIKRVPVIVVSTLTANDYAAMGFTTKKVGSYYVVEDQLVVGLNVNHETVKKEKEPKYLENVKQVLEHKSGDKYYVPKDVEHYKQSGLKYYWMVPEKAIDNMRKETGSFFNIKNWGFAFR